jgi:hypothetical protein
MRFRTLTNPSRAAFTGAPKIGTASATDAPTSAIGTNLLPIVRRSVFQPLTGGASWAVNPSSVGWGGTVTGPAAIGSAVPIDAPRPSDIPNAAPRSLVRNTPRTSSLGPRRNCRACSLVAGGVLEGIWERGCGREKGGMKIHLYGTPERLPSISHPHYYSYRGTSRSSIIERP